MNKIACIGWGSLIWNSRNLQIQNKWFEDGPLLPIEFTRISNDKRVTLIIDNNANPIRTLWAIMTSVDLKTAIESLEEREKSKNILSVKSTDNDDGNDIKSTIIHWLKSKQLDAAIWTGLSFNEKFNKTRPSIDEIIKHLNELSYTEGSAAKEYIINAPKQIDTEYRRRIEIEFGWASKT